MLALQAGDVLVAINDSNPTKTGRKRSNIGTKSIIGNRSGGN